MRLLFFISIFTSILLLTAGCGKSENIKVSKVQIVSGSGQSAPAGKKFARPLRVKLTGSKVEGLLGKGDALPVPGVKVRFVNSGNSNIKITPEYAVSDVGGTVETVLEAPAGTVGEQYIEVIPEGFESQKVKVKLFSGIEVTGVDREYMAKSLSSDPLRVKITRNGQGVAGVPVRFSMGSTSEGVRTSAYPVLAEAVTDSSGVAETHVRLGKKTGTYQILISANAPDKQVVFRDMKVQLQALDPVSVLICVIGGLAFFIFGMCMMSDGIKLVAGENMRKILSFFTGNRFFALLAGTLVTAVLQSSSATTLMVIGFINAGLLNLTQSIGIIFGANIGTTITAQLIALNLSGIAIPCVALGFFLTLTKKRVINAWGTVILGFGLLFFGMTMMSSELKLLGEMASFRSFFNLFNCAPSAGTAFMPLPAVLGALGIGLVMTMILQSSSAFTGIVLALAAGRLIDFYTAVPLLIGSNIGTTFTAQLGALSANRVAKQAAMAHTLFNLWGAVVVIAVCYIPYKNTPAFLYLIDVITPGDIFAASPQNLERHIAMFHTIFNVAVALVLLPFVSHISNICNRIIPIRNKVRTKLLEPGLLSTPSVALKLTARALQTMVNQAWDMVDRSVNDHFLAGDTSEKKYGELAESEMHIDQMQAEVTDYLVQMTRRRLTEPQSGLIPLLMHCTNDAERIADHTEIILELNDRMVNQEKKLSDTAKKELKKMWKHLDELANQVIAGLSGAELPSPLTLQRENRYLHKLAAKLEAEHIERLRVGSCSAAGGVIYIEMLGELVKIGDRLSNIAERTPEIQKHYVNL